MSSKYQSLFESKFVIVMYKTDPSAEHAISASLNIFGGFSVDFRLIRQSAAAKGSSIMLSL